MIKYFKKHETLICIFLIIIYLVSNTYCLQNFGITDYRTAICNIGLVLIIMIFIMKNKFLDYYGLKTFPKFKEFLYFIPLLLIITVNLWGGFVIDNSLKEILFYIVSMICVGFLEEIIFRGFLFKMMARDSVTFAMIISSLTFGIGHIINLLNGAPLVSTLIQIISAIVIGYLFVLIFYKGKSLWPCIITHIGINSLSIFSVDNTVSLYIAPFVLVVISVFYIIYLNKYLKRFD